MPFKNLPPAYNVWASMKDRCSNPNNAQFKNYGARGISVCERWRESYQAFFEDMGPRPSPKHSVDRINNDGNYEPNNCRWADSKTQTRNMRRNRLIEIGGVMYRVTTLVEKSGLSRNCIIRRAESGLSLSEVLDPSRRVYHEGLRLGGRSNGDRIQAKTHCKRGHEFSDANTYLDPRGIRHCRECHNAKMRQRNEAARIARIGHSP